VWLNEDYTLFSDFPDNLIISKSAKDTFTIMAAELTNIRWSLNGKDIPAPRGAAREITFEAVSYVPGNYTLGLYAEKAGVPYSFNTTFKVAN
jgi:hypothetical protein